MKARALATILFFVLATPAMRELLESAMVTHMLVQIPLLAVVGALLGSALPARWKARIAEWNRWGVSGIALAFIVSSWWMVPRALDLALSSPAIEAAKFVSLPLFVGAPLGVSWRQLGSLGRGFVLANALPMWAVVGWLYIAAPVRVCNYYLVDQQVVAGSGLLWVSGVVGLIACALAFRSQGTAGAAA